MEASPWSRLLYHSSVAVLANGVNLGRLPDLWSIHAYGDPATEPKDWDPLEDPRDGNGWRWELNAISTCREDIEAAEAALGVGPRPVVVTEFNTAARGTAPSVKYVRMWLLGVLLVMRAHWSAIQWAAADAEAGWLQSHGW